MGTAELITFSVFMTMACWLLAVVVGPLAENKTHYQITLCLIFWPIGVPIMAIVGIVCLVILCFSKEEDEGHYEKLYLDKFICKYCGKTLRIGSDKCTYCFAPVKKD